LASRPSRVDGRTQDANRIIVDAHPTANVGEAEVRKVLVISFRIADS
jgi:hypothetical protein